MTKFVIVIGQSASGKTTFVKEKYLSALAINENPRKYIKTCYCGNTLLLGHFNLGIRCEGTDTLSYSALPALIEYLPEVVNSFDTIVAEGDRLNNKRFFIFVKSLNIPVELIYFKCSLEDSIERRGDASISFVKTTITKSKNMYDFGVSLGFSGRIVNT